MTTFRRLHPDVLADKKNLSTVQEQSPSPYVSSLFLTESSPGISIFHKYRGPQSAEQHHLVSCNLDPCPPPYTCFLTSLFQSQTNYLQPYLLPQSLWLHLAILGGEHRREKFVVSFASSLVRICRCGAKTWRVSSGARESFDIVEFSGKDYRGCDFEQW